MHLSTAVKSFGNVCDSLVICFHVRPCYCQSGNCADRVPTPNNRINSLFCVFSTWFRLASRAQWEIQSIFDFGWSELRSFPTILLQRKHDSEI